MLDEFRLPMRIEILGNENKTKTLNITVKSYGPEVEVVFPENKIIDFGPVEVLTDEYRTLKLFNNSKINAEFHAFTREPSEKTWFKPMISKGVIKAETEFEITIQCNANDERTFSDKLHVMMTETDRSIDIDLQAKAHGQTIYDYSKLKDIDFGTAYTFRPLIEEVFIENRGAKT